MESRNTESRASGTSHQSGSTKGGSKGGSRLSGSRLTGSRVSRGKVVQKAAKMVVTGEVHLARAFTAVAGEKTLEEMRSWTPIRGLSAMDVDHAGESRASGMSSAGRGASQAAGQLLSGMSIIDLEEMEDGSGGTTTAKGKTLSKMIGLFSLLVGIPAIFSIISIWVASDGVFQQERQLATSNEKYSQLQLQVAQTKLYASAQHILRYAEIEAVRGGGGDEAAGETARRLRFKFESKLNDLLKIDLTEYFKQNSWRNQKIFTQGWQLKQGFFENDQTFTTQLVDLVNEIQANSTAVGGSSDVLLHHLRYSFEPFDKANQITDKLHEFATRNENFLAAYFLEVFNNYVLSETQLLISYFLLYYDCSEMNIAYLSEVKGGRDSWHDILTVTFPEWQVWIDDVEFKQKYLEIREYERRFEAALSSGACGLKKNLNVETYADSVEKYLTLLMIDLANAKEKATSVDISLQQSVASVSRSWLIMAIFLSIIIAVLAVVYVVVLFHIISSAITVISSFFDSVEYIDTASRHIVNTLQLYVPKNVSMEIANGTESVPEFYNCLSIVSIDIANINNLVFKCKSVTPLIEYIQRFHRLMDAITRNYKHYKLESCGSRYSIAVGLLVRYKTSDCATKACQLTYTILEKFKRNFDLLIYETRQIELRVAVTTGSGISGLLNCACPHYQVFGDCCTLIEPLMNICEPSKVLICRGTWAIMEPLASAFTFTPFETVHTKHITEPCYELTLRSGRLKQRLDAESILMDEPDDDNASTLSGGTRSPSMLGVPGE